MATQGSSASAVSRGGTGTTSTPANNVGGDYTSATNRRPSTGSQNTLFSGLVNQKRNSTDAAANARKQSFSDMKPATGFLGKMWSDFTTGSSPPK
ncbi:Conidiation-specific protein [Lachnellula hyalina]|uniref:Conidiation-specific protein n=1 Tax=Lachnellula hyalina TaxID=1316788 RepID=A0A8H8QY49_9HELO|nr:Conidiation-specific protein [Lachnellula hyalina]TVY25007.1 Conidiation-specific protein [Lachnellula hyalina]